MRHEGQFQWNTGRKKEKENMQNRMKSTSLEDQQHHKFFFQQKIKQDIDTDQYWLM